MVKIFLVLVKLMVLTAMVMVRAKNQIPLVTWVMIAMVEFDDDVRILFYTKSDLLLLMFVYVYICFKMISYLCIYANVSQALLKYHTLINTNYHLLY